MSTETNDEQLFDTSGVPKTEMTSSPRITTAGIKNDLRVACELKTGKYKDQVKNPGDWYAFSVTLTDPDNFEFTELYFQPPSKIDQIDPNRKYPMKKYTQVEKKTVESGVMTEKEELQMLNNEFLAYLLDLGEALGYQYNDVRDHLYKNLTGGFKGLCEAFLSKFRPTDSTRISAKFLWYNNKNKQTSQLRIHGNFPAYYPYGNDFFDVYKEDRPTVLKISEYEGKTGLNKQFVGDGSTPSGTNTINKSEAASIDEDAF